MATPKQIYLPEIDSTIEIPEGMDEIKAKERAIQIFQKKFPNQYSEINSAYEFNKKYIKSFDEDQPANSAPVETQNTNQASSTKQQKKLPFENIATMGGMGMINPALDSLLGLLKLTGAPDNKYVKAGMRIVSPLAGASLLDKGTQDAAANSAAESMTANLVNPLKAGAATTLDEVMQLIGASEEKPALDTYKNYRDVQKGSIKKRWEEHPLASMFGTLEGAINPESVGTQLFTKGGKLVEGATSKVIQNFPTLKKLLDATITGAGSSLAYQAIDPELDIKNPGKTAGIGALLNLAPIAAVEGGKKILNSSLLKDRALPSLKSGLKENPLSGWLVSMVDSFKKGKFQNTMDKMNAGMGLDDKPGVIKQLINAADDVKAGITKPYKELKGSLFQKFGESKGDTTQLKTAIGDLFKKEGLLSSEGKVDLSKLSQFKITSDKLKQYKELAQLYEGLNKGDMSLNTVKTILESIGDKAKFKALDRGSFEKQLGSLYNSTRGSIDDTLGNLAGGKTKEVFQNLRKNVAEVKDVFGKRNVGLDKILRKEPEKIIDSIKTNLSPNYVKEVVSKYPKLKTPVEKVILSHFFNKATDSKSLARLMKNYGPKELQSILSKENFNILQKLVGNKELFQKVKSQGLDWSGVKATLPRLFDSKTQ